MNSSIDLLLQKKSTQGSAEPVESVSNCPVDMTPGVRVLSGCGRTESQKPHEFVGELNWRQLFHNDKCWVNYISPRLQSIQEMIFPALQNR